MGWLREYVRRNTRQIHPDVAIKWKKILSGLYFFTAWNIMTYGIYLMFKNRHPTSPEDKESPSRYYARLLSTGDAKVYKFSGFQMTGEFEIEGAKLPERGHSREYYEQLEASKKKKKTVDEDLALLVEEVDSQ